MDISAHADRLHPFIRLREWDLHRHVSDGIRLTSLLGRVHCIARSTRSTVRMSFQIRYALHTPRSSAGCTAEDRSVRAFGVGASYSRTPALRRKCLAQPTA